MKKNLSAFPFLPIEQILLEEILHPQRPSVWQHWFSTLMILCMILAVGSRSIEMVSVLALLLFDRHLKRDNNYPKGFKLTYFQNFSCTYLHQVKSSKNLWLIDIISQAWKPQRKFVTPTLPGSTPLRKGWLWPNRKECSLLARPCLTPKTCVSKTLTFVGALRRKV